MDVSQLDAGRVYKFFLYVILLAFISFTGLVGNLTSFYILRKDKPRKATHIILSSLAIIDSVFLFTSFAMFTVPYFLMDPSSFTYHMYTLTGPFLYALGHAMRMMRNWTVVIVSFERWVAVSKPLKAASIWTNGLANRAMLLILFICSLYSLPRFFEMTCVEELKLKDDNETITYFELDYSILKEHYLYNLLYRIVGYCLFVIGGPLLLVTVFNIKLIISIKQANKNRKKLHYEGYKQRRSTVDNLGNITKINSLDPFSNLNANTTRKLGQAREKQKEGKNLHVTLICIIILFCYTLCEAPPLVTQVFLTILDKTNGIIFQILFPLSNLSTTLNSGINFYIYVLCGRHFRKHLACWRGNKEGSPNKLEESRKNTAYLYTRRPRAATFEQTGKYHRYIPVCRRISHNGQNLFNYNSQISISAELHLGSAQGNECRHGGEYSNATIEKDLSIITTASK